MGFLKKLVERRRQARAGRKGAGMTFEQEFEIGRLFNESPESRFRVRRLGIERAIEAIPEIAGEAGQKGIPLRKLAANYFDLIEKGPEFSGLRGLASRMRQTAAREKKPFDEQRLWAMAVREYKRLGRVPTERELFPEA